MDFLLVVTSTGFSGNILSKLSSINKKLCSLRCLFFILFQGFKLRLAFHKIKNHAIGVVSCLM